MRTLSYLFLTLSIASFILCENVEFEMERFLDIENIIDSVVLEEMEFSNRESAAVFLADPVKDKQFADFLNAFYGSSMGNDILKKCSKPYSPDSSAHEAFLSQYAKVYANVNTLITKKTIKEVTGAQCTYNVSDPKTFITAKKAEIPTMALFSSLLAKTSFGKGLLAFSNCIGATELGKLSSPAYVEEVLYLIATEKSLNRLFESFCTINNMFYFLNANVDAKDPAAFQKIGKALNGLFNSVKLHYEFIKKNP